MINFEKGSFRDPGGNIFYYNNEVYRKINNLGLKRFEFLLKNNLLQDLIDKKFLINTEIIKNKDFLGLNNDATIIKHKKIEFISYPYEWTFNQLKDAALFHLELQIYLLKKNSKLIDASPYNIQFIDNRPIFIDVLSIDKYNDGDYWFGHRQFCEGFLNPLILKAKKGIDFNNWFKGNLEGITVEDTYNLLNLIDFLSPTIFLNVFLLKKTSKKTEKEFKKEIFKIKNRKWNKESYFFVLKNLRSFISKLSPKYNRSTWEKYSEDHYYKKYEEEKKIEVVKNFLIKSNIKLLADLGCNDGKFSKYAFENNMKVIGFDFDLNVLDKSYLEAKKNNHSFLPLFSDFSNPSSNIGWNNSERKSLNARANFDGLIALALVHHLVLAKNIPLNEVLDWLVGLAPKGLIEFVPKNDYTVKIMLKFKEDIFPNYNEANFEKILSSLTNIKNVTKITDSDRKIYEFSNT